VPTDPLEQPGGQVLWTTNELITSDDLNRMGPVAAASIFDLVLGRLFFEDQEDASFSGVFGDGLQVTLVSGLQVQIGTGWGMYEDTTVTDAFGVVYRPVVLSTAENETLDAHDANPRIDVISIGPATEDDEAASRYFKSGGSASVSSVDTRRVWSSTITVTKGTAAASPTAPSTPSGHIKLAEIDVPATSGAITIRDHRPRLHFGQQALCVPPAEYMTNFVPGSATELQVSASSPAAMTVEVAAGEADVQGHRYRYPAETLTVTAADPTNSRIDIVVADADGTLSVTAGTPAASPTAPTPAADQAILATILVAALASSITSGVITDSRKRAPVGSSQVQDGALLAANLADDVKPVYPKLTYVSGGGYGAAAVYSLQITDGDGNSVERQCDVVVTLRDSTYQHIGAGSPSDLAETGGGSELAAGTNATTLLLRTSALGAAAITATPPGSTPPGSGPTIYMEATIVGEAGGGADYVSWTA